MIYGSNVIKFKSGIRKGMELIESGENEALGLLIVCGLNFGLRISDLLRVTYSDLRSGEFVINEKKTGKRRLIVVNSNVRKAVAMMPHSIQMELGGSPFLSRKGTVFSQQHVNRMLKDVFGEGYSSHGLRKGFGRRLYKRKNDLGLVQLQLQHSSPADTLRYIGITNDNLRKSFNDIE